jgi:hypothetical protein
VNGVGERVVILHTQTCHHQQQRSRCKRASESLARPARGGVRNGEYLSILKAGIDGIVNIANTTDDI